MANVPELFSHGLLYDGFWGSHKEKLYEEKTFTIIISLKKTLIKYERLDL